MPSPRGLVPLTEYMLPAVDTLPGLAVCYEAVPRGLDLDTVRALVVQALQRVTPIGALRMVNEYGKVELPDNPEPLDVATHCSTGQPPFTGHRQQTLLLSYRQLSQHDGGWGSAVLSPSGAQPGLARPFRAAVTLAHPNSATADDPSRHVTLSVLRIAHALGHGFGMQLRHHGPRTQCIMSTEPPEQQLNMDSLCITDTRRFCGDCLSALLPRRGTR